MPVKVLTKEQFAPVQEEARKLMTPTGESSSSGVSKAEYLATTACAAIDAAAPRLDISGGGGASSSPVGKQDVVVCQSDVNVAISTLQGFFLKGGVSIALAGESHRYKDDPPDEPKATPGLGGLAQAVLDNDTQGWGPREFLMAQQDQQKLAAFQLEKTKFDLEMKTYRDSQADCRRAKELLKNGTGGTVFPKADLIVLERAMKEYASFKSAVTVREDDLLGEWSIRQRSALIAAYIFVCAAAGPSGHVLVIFGEEHKDIFDFFEYFATHSKAFTNVGHVQRNYCLIESHVK